TIPRQIPRQSSASSQVAACVVDASADLLMIEQAASAGIFPNGLLLGFLTQLGFMRLSLDQKNPFPACNGARARNIPVGSVAIADSQPPGTNICTGRRIK